MKRWEVLLWFCGIFTLVLGGYFLWFNPEPEVAPAIIEVNQHARLAASGSPLPSVAHEDVLVDQQQFDGSVFKLAYDYPSGNWQLDFVLSATVHRLRYVKQTNQFFYWSIQDSLWDEVNPKLLNENLRALTDIEQFLLTEEQLDSFNQAALEEESKTCKQDKVVSCAVWRAYNPDSHQEVLIYVNKQTRKIDHVITLNTVDGTQSPIVATYYYQPLEIEPPADTEVRYLP